MTITNQKISSKKVVVEGSSTLKSSTRILTAEGWKRRNKLRQKSKK